MGHTRVCGSKSRGGYRTCKRRRVKCDESRPCCMRCLSSNWLCEGYGIRIDMSTRPTYDQLLPKFNVPPSQKVSMSAIKPKPAMSISYIPFLDHSECLTFERFRSQAVLHIGGVRSSSFWQNIVLPACYSEPAVLHASMAFVGATQPQRGLLSKPVFNKEEADQLNTFSEYNKAIQHLKAHMSKLDDPSSLRVVLITCIIFIALELSSGRIATAIIHLHEGRKLLQLSSHLASHSRDDAEDETKTLLLTPTPQSIEDELVGVFADLDLQSTWYGSSRPQLKLTAQKLMKIPHSQLSPKSFSTFVLPADFQSIQEANQYFVILANKCLDFIGDRFQDIHTLQNEVSNFHRQYLSTLLVDWRNRYDRFCLKLNDAKIPEWSWKQHPTLMLIQHAWLSLVISTSYLEIEETDLDAYLHYFTTIVSLSSTILEKEAGKGTQGSSPSYSLELGVVAPLWFTTMKCRHPQVRHQALRLLRLAPREGLWDPVLVAQLAHEAIKLEEGVDDSLVEGSTLNGGCSYQDDNWRELIPLHRRISAAHIIFEDEDYQMLIMTFKRKTWGTDGKCTGVEDIVVKQPYQASRCAL